MTTVGCDFCFNFGLKFAPFSRPHLSALLMSSDSDFTPVFSRGGGFNRRVILSDSESSDVSVFDGEDEADDSIFVVGSDGSMNDSDESFVNISHDISHIKHTKYNTPEHKYKNKTPTTTTTTTTTTNPSTNNTPPHPQQQQQQQQQSQQPPASPDESLR